MPVWIDLVIPAVLSPEVADAGGPGATGVWREVAAQVVRGANVPSGPESYTHSTIFSFNY